MAIVLGINSAYHESAAALVRDGIVVAAVEEERFSRLKRGKAARVDNADELPWRAIEWVLKAGGVSRREAVFVAYSFAPRERLRNVGVDPLPLGDPIGWGSAVGERAFEAALTRVPERLRERGIATALPPERMVHFIPHHVAHAASAFYPSGFESAAVLVLDGIAEHDTTWLGRGETSPDRGDGLDRIEAQQYPHSLGLVWERVALHLGFTEYDAPKVMGLAALGNPEPYREALARVLRVDPEGRIAVDLDLARFRAADTTSLTPLFGAPRGPDESPEEARFADIAAALQRASEEAVLAIARRLARITGKRRLCYAGGVALNCVANARLEREGPFEAIYVAPAAHDAGTAIGAALEVAAFYREPVAQLGKPPLTPFLGPSFDERACLEAVEAAGLRAERLADAPAEAARALASGAIVGWFDGALEIGPRALGHRSILADPRRAGVRDELNRRIKHREGFRPFGASIIAEAAHDWFDLPPTKASPSRELMLFAYPVKPARRADIPAVVHRDGTCRIQTVEGKRDPRFHALLSALGRETGAPIALNTSFNDSEPIVLSPADALRTGRAARLDRLFLGDLDVRL